METQFVEVTASISMSKSLCVEVPEGATSDEIIEKAKSEFILPNQCLDILNNVCQQFGLRIGNVNIKDATRDWIVDELEFITDANK